MGKKRMDKMKSDITNDHIFNKHYVLRLVKLCVRNTKAYMMTTSVM